MLRVFSAILAAILVSLQVAGVISIGFFWAFSPLLIPLLFVIVVFLLYATASVAAIGITKLARKLSRKRGGY